MSRAHPPKPVLQPCNNLIDVPDGLEQLAPPVSRIVDSCENDCDVDRFTEARSHRRERRRMAGRSGGFFEIVTDSENRPSYRYADLSTARPSSSCSERLLPHRLHMIQEIDEPEDTVKATKLQSQESHNEIVPHASSESVLFCLLEESPSCVAPQHRHEQRSVGLKQDTNQQEVAVIEDQPTAIQKPKEKMHQLGEVMTNEFSHSRVVQKNSTQPQRSNTCRIDMPSTPKRLDVHQKAVLPKHNSLSEQQQSVIGTESHCRESLDSHHERDSQANTDFFDSKSPKRFSIRSISPDDCHRSVREEQTGCVNFRTKS